MDNELKKIINYFFRRDWIQNREGKLTFVQLFGFLLITHSVVYFSSFLLPSGIINFFPSLKLEDTANNEGISIAFFTVMLGVAFAFPDMLKGQTKDISTMRIVVFMLVNVICMLLLKIGWNKTSLEDIGLDGYWMGVIALLFGAKAAQSYFENAKAFFNEQKPQAPINNNVPVKNSLSSIAISQIAKVQNEESLFEKYQNIESVSDTVKNGSSCLTIYVRDNNVNKIPKFVEVELNENERIKIPTEIIGESGEGIPHIGQLENNIRDSIFPPYRGSICCIVNSLTNPNLIGIVTSGHIFTHGQFLNYGGVLGQNQRSNVLINDNPIAKLFFQQMRFNQDIAIAEFDNGLNQIEEYKSFAKGFYQVSLTDINSETENVTVLSRKNNKRDAFILDFNVSFEISYGDLKKNIRNIILIGSTNDKATSKTVSEEGDSGSCVYHKESDKLIGILLGGNRKFTFVLPIEATLNTFNFKPL